MPGPHQLVDHAGKTFGEWTVLHPADPVRRHGATYWTCRCSCGEVRDVQMKTVLAGRSKRCAVCARRVKKHLTVIRWGNRTMKRAEWARALGMPNQTLAWRMASGWELRDALTVGADPVVLDLLVPDRTMEPEYLPTGTESG